MKKWTVWKYGDVDDAPAISYLILIILVFIAGLVTMSLEFASSRLLVPIFGSSIYTWGSLIGVILAGLSLGYHVGGKLADKKEPNFVKFCSIIFSAGLYIIFIPIIAPVIVSYTSAALTAQPNQYASLPATIMLLLFPTFLLGIVSPYAVKLATKTLSTLGNISGNLYSAATIGSIAGTFLTVFVLIPNFEIDHIIFGLGLSLIISSVLSGLLKRIPAILAGLIILFLIFSNTFLVVNPVPYYSGNLVYQKETPYSHLDVVDSNDKRALFLDGQIHSIMYNDNPNELVIDYTKYFPLGFLFSPAAKNILFVGGGGFSGPKYFLQNYPNVTADVVEIDPVVLDVAKKYFKVDPNNPRLDTYNDDARSFLTKTDKRYDMIILDAYSKNYVPFHLMTLEYYQLLYSKLSSTGVILSHNLGSLDDSKDTSKLYRAVYKTMSQVFPSVYVFPVGSFVNSNNSTGVQNIILVAAKNPDTQEYNNDDIKESQQRHLLSEGNEGIIDYASRLYNKATITEDVPLLTDQYAPVEKLLNPITREPYNIGSQVMVNPKVDLHSIQGIAIAFVLPVIIATVWIFYLKKTWIENV